MIPKHLTVTAIPKDGSPVIVTRKGKKYLGRVLDAYESQVLVEIKTFFLVRHYWVWAEYVRPIVAHKILS